MKKRFICLLLSVLMLVAIPVGVNAARMPNPNNYVGGPLPFTDVPLYSWYRESVVYVYDLSIINGITTTTFEPESTIRREDVVVMIGRAYEAMEFSVGTSTATPFTDISSNAYYSKYVAWAYRNEIVNGISTTQFGIGQAMTRQDFCVILNRFANFCGFVINNMGGSASFSDSDSISSYALSAVQTCAKGIIINGFGDNTFRPQTTVRRCEAAHMLTKYAQYHAS